MAQIENIKTKEAVFLSSYHLFGRNRALCNTYIQASDVSQAHATVYWSDYSWHIRDHSRNGTLVNGEVIRKSTARLNIGTQIKFGSINEFTWNVTDTQAPANYLRSLDNRNRILILDACRALPDEQKPGMLFYVSDNNEWIAESAEQKIILTNGVRFRFSNEEWEFVANDVLYDTLDYGYIVQSAFFKFCISPNEEDIRLTLVVDDHEYDLGRRSYNYLLLALTRKRLADLNCGLAAADQGWMYRHDLEKDVSRELGYQVDEYYVNLQIFRLRKQLMEIKPFGHLFSKIIERRTGALRFMFPQVKLIKDDVCIGEITCS